MAARRRAPPLAAGSNDLCLNVTDSLSSNYGVPNNSNNNYPILVLLSIIIGLLLMQGQGGERGGRRPFLLLPEIQWKANGGMTSLADHDEHQANMFRINKLNDSITFLRNRLVAVERKQAINMAEISVVSERLYKHNESVNTQRNALEHSLSTWQQVNAANEASSEKVISDMETKLLQLKSKLEIVRTLHENATSASVSSCSSNRNEETAEEWQSLVVRVAGLETLISTAITTQALQVKEPAPDVDVSEVVRKVWVEEAEPLFLQGLNETVVVELSADTELFSSLSPEPLETVETMETMETVETVETVETMEPLLEPLMEPLEHTKGTDYASRRSGGLVMHGLSSETFVPDHLMVGRVVEGVLQSWVGGKAAQTVARNVAAVKLSLPSIFGLLGVDAGVGSPEDAISSDMQLGSCWPMAGHRGMLAVKLAQEVQVTEISIEHIARIEAIDISSAPRAFSVYATDEYGTELRVLAEGEYSLEDGHPLQTFAVADEGSHDPVQYVALKIHSNHGHSDYTCLYSFKVYGRMEGN